MLSLPIAPGLQIPLIYEVRSDDADLRNTIDGEWFDILDHFPWQDYRQVAADYYNARYDFNQLPPQKATEDDAINPETQGEARQRLLFDRATAPQPTAPPAPIPYQGEVVAAQTQDVQAADVAPGLVPPRLVGRKPKCFFGLLKGFIGASLMGFAPEPEQVRLLLKSNPAFARVCGFFHQRKDCDDYHFEAVPSLRKLEPFDQIMTAAGLWGRIKRTAVTDNLASGVIQPEPELVGDTTHFHAYSSFETVPYQDAHGKEQKKSQSKRTKTCGCEDWHACPHAWALRDEGAGTIVKSGKQMIWGHKASAIGLPKQGIVLDAVAVADAATHDGQTFYPHVQSVLGAYPLLAASVQRVLYDSACIGCQHLAQYCNRTPASGRTITVPFDTLKHIDPEDPPMAKRFKAIMTRRPAVERMIKRLKCDLGDDRLSTRGNECFQATLWIRR